LAFAHALPTLLRCLWWPPCACSAACESWLQQCSNHQLRLHRLRPSRASTRTRTGEGVSHRHSYDGSTNQAGAAGLVVLCWARDWGASQRLVGTCAVTLARSSLVKRGTGREGCVGRVGSCTSGSCAKRKRKTPNATITTDSPFSHDMLERSTSLQARHCAHKCTVVHNNNTVVQGRTSELTAGLGGLALGSGSSADVWPAKWWPGVWQLVATARRWSPLYFRGAQLDAVHCSATHSTSHAHRSKRQWSVQSFERAVHETHLGLSARVATIVF